jgi:hypothetical protein
MRFAVTCDFFPRCGAVAALLGACFFAVPSPARADTEAAAAVPSAGPAVDTPVPEWHWRLAGIIVGPGLREALFSLNGETRVIREGRELDGWALTGVRANAVTLSAAGQAMTVKVQELTDGEAMRGSTPVARAAQAAVKAALKQQADGERTAVKVLVEATRAMMVEQASRNRQRPK